VFTHLDQDQDLVVDAQEIVKFLKQNLIRIDVSDAELIVKEYDGNNDGNLDFEEFCAMVLPATDKILKEIAINRADKFNKSKPLSNLVISGLCDLLERELKF
jgi:hypothetical protein